MATEPTNSSAASVPSADRLWAEQLAAGLAILIGVLIFMAFYHPKLLSTGAQVALSTGDLVAYGWASVIGVVFLLIIHEIGTLTVAHHFRLPIKFRLFPFGVNAAATLGAQPRNVWIDAMVGLAGPVTGSLVSLALVATYKITGNPFFLGMACVGYFYNLFTLVPILELEGGWVGPAISPQAWFLGLVASILPADRGLQPCPFRRRFLRHPSAGAAHPRAGRAGRPGLHGTPAADRRAGLLRPRARAGVARQQHVRLALAPRARGDGRLARSWPFPSST